MASKVVFALILLSASITESWSKSVSSVSIGGMDIFTDGKNLRCDSLTCPEIADSCVISVKTDPQNNTKVETWKRCLDKDNNIVMEDKFTTENNNPHDHTNIYIASGRNGYISTVDAAEGKRLAEKIIKEVQDELQGIWNWNLWT